MALTKTDVIKLIKKEVKENLDQQDITSDLIKQRHVGEGIRFIRAGTAANRPTSGELNGAIYFATDTAVLSLWDGSAWVTLPRIPASPEDYTMTNVTTDRVLDADSTTTAELADVLATLITDLIAIGLID